MVLNTSELRVWLARVEAVLGTLGWVNLLALSLFPEHLFIALLFTNTTLFIAAIVLHYINWRLKKERRHPNTTT